MQLENLSVHVDVSIHNSAGTVFINALARLTVILVQEPTELEEVAELTRLALNDVKGLGGDALLCDLRGLSDPSTAAISRVVANLVIPLSSVRRLVLLVTPSSVAATQQMLLVTCGSLGVRAFAAVTAAKGVEWLEHFEPADKIHPLQDNLPPNFWSTYNGSIYSIPEYRCTVLRMSGYTRDSEGKAALLHQGFALHSKMQASILLIDTRSSPPIDTPERHILAYRDFIEPVISPGVCESLIHVRAGDSLFLLRGTGSPRPLIESKGIAYFELTTMEQAIETLKILRGDIVGATRPAGLTFITS